MHRRSGWNSRRLLIVAAFLCVPGWALAQGGTSAAPPGGTPPPAAPPSPGSVKADLVPSPAPYAYPYAFPR
jgi:hypothetical protein